MDIENLSKTDIILMALLISFVTALMTAIVVIFLLEDAPEDTVQIRERFVTTEATTTAATGSVQNVVDQIDESNTETSANLSRDEILEKAVAAVARVTATDVHPQAGILVSFSGRDLIMTPPVDYPTEAQGLFEDGVVADLELIGDTTEFAYLQLSAASDILNPLTFSRQAPEVGDSVFVVPLTQQPQIIRVSITDVSDAGITTSAEQLPFTSLLFDDLGQLQGVFSTDRNVFIDADSITAFDIGR